VLEPIHLVLDRPADGDPRALVYLAEPVGRPKQVPIAVSPAVDRSMTHRRLAEQIVGHRVCRVDAHAAAAGSMRSRRGGADRSRDSCDSDRPHCAAGVWSSYVVSCVALQSRSLRPTHERSSIGLGSIPDSVPAQVSPVAGITGHVRRAAR